MQRVTRDCDFSTCSNDQYETAGLIRIVGHAAAALWAARDITSLRGYSLWPPNRARPQLNVVPAFIPATRAPGLVLQAQF